MVATGCRALAYTNVTYDGNVIYARQLPYARPSFETPSLREGSSG
jgi:hypothetical protein